MTAIERGFGTMDAATYHADPCPTPSLSSHIAHILLSQSPRHAWTEHPKLNPGYAPTHRRQFDLGTAAHAYLLEGESGDGMVIIDAADYRTNKAQEQRDAAYAEGKTPILLGDWDDVKSMAAAARTQLGRHPQPVPLLGGQPEQTLVWQEGNIWCRARLDYLHDSRLFIDDYKSTSGNAHPDAWIRSALFGSGYDLQAAFYLRGIKVLFGIDATFRFVPQETYPPYALSVVGLGPDVLTLAEKKRLRAVELWDECLTSGVWPAYPTNTCTADLPPWEENAWLLREERELAEMERRNR